jgi:3-oxoacyl-[acyl-carrier protein] reductase
MAATRPGISLAGQIALVTGSSRGIGAVIARKMASAGAKVALNYNASVDAAIEVRDSIASTGGEAMIIAGDVSDENQAEQTIKAVVREFGRIDILVNNAGIHRDRLLLRMTPDDFDQVLQVNLRGAFLCTKYVMPHLIRQHYGRVINMSSVVGLTGNPGQANYAAAKAGLIGFTKAVAREVASRNVTVNAVAPGYIATGMVEDLSEEQQKQILERIPMGRFGTSEDVAETILFLSSKGAGYLTGQVLTIDGGLIA